METGIEKIGSNSIGVLKDPFMKSNITAIRVSSYKSSYSVNHYGTVEFQNGNSKGEQKFTGDSFDDVVLKIKKFIDLELR